jgi:hypothetical protein
MKKLVSDEEAKLETELAKLDKSEDEKIQVRNH